MEIIKNKWGCQFAVLPCPDCGKSWKTRIVKGQLVSKRCLQCANKLNGAKRRGSAHPNWKGGRRLFREYIHIFISSNSPFFAMANRIVKSKGTGEITGAYILEHRLVMAKYLGRLLKDNEIVHHKNGHKQDNRIENLQLTEWNGHTTSYSHAYSQGYKEGYKNGSHHM